MIKSQAHQIKDSVSPGVVSRWTIKVLRKELKELKMIQKEKEATEKLLKKVKHKGLVEEVKKRLEEIKEKEEDQIRFIEEYKNQQIVLMKLWRKEVEATEKVLEQVKKGEEIEIFELSDQVSFKEALRKYDPSGQFPFYLIPHENREKMLKNGELQVSDVMPSPDSDFFRDMKRYGLILLSYTHYEPLWREFAVLRQKIQNAEENEIKFYKEEVKNVRKYIEEREKVLEDKQWKKCLKTSK